MSDLLMLAELGPHSAAMHPEPTRQRVHAGAVSAGCSHSVHFLVRETCSRSLLWFRRYADQRVLRLAVGLGIPVNALTPRGNQPLNPWSPVPAALHCVDPRCLTGDRDIERCGAPEAVQRIGRPARRSRSGTRTPTEHGPSANDSSTHRAQRRMAGPCRCWPSRGWWCRCCGSAATAAPRAPECGGTTPPQSWPQGTTSSWPHSDPEGLTRAPPPGSQLPSARVRRGLRPYPDPVEKGSHPALGIRDRRDVPGVRRRQGRVCRPTPRCTSCRVRRGCHRR